MKKFNIYNFVSDDDFRPAMGGVFHDGGYKVACDSIILVAVRSDYPEELEHHVLDKDGKDILTAYPKWRACLPDGVDYKPYSIDPAQFEAFIKERVNRGGPEQARAPGGGTGSGMSRSARLILGRTSLNYSSRR